MFAVPAEPKLTAAKATGNSVAVSGAGLVDLKACKSTLAFQVQKTGGAAQPVEKQKLESSTKATFEAPDISAGEWSVVVLVDGQVKGTVKLEK